MTYLFKLTETLKSPKLLNIPICIELFIYQVVHSPTSKQKFHQENSPICDIIDVKKVGNLNLKLRKIKLFQFATRQLVLFKNKYF